MSAVADVAAAQRRLWGRRPRDWAELAEPQNRALFDAVLDRTGVTKDTRLLDAGCGSGLAAQLAAARGARVAGIDATPELLEIARARVPDGTFHEAPLEALPFAAGDFDVVTAFNAVPFAADPVAALREAARVARPGALVAATTFAEPERCESTALHRAMKALAPEQPGEGYAPYALSSPGGLEALLAAAGLEPAGGAEVPVVWGHADVETTIRSLLCSAGGARALDAAGEHAVRAALAPAIAPFVDPRGAVHMHNVFRYAIGRVPAPAAAAA